MHKSDTVDVGVSRISGELSISIGQENREAIYEGRNHELSYFRVMIQENGDYIFSASGKRAVVSVSFQINRISD